MHEILLVDDDKTQRQIIKTILTDHMSLKVSEARNGQECLDLLTFKKNPKNKLVVLDVSMPVMGGMETLRRLQEKYPSLPVIFVTGNDQTDIAVEAMKSGAIDFFTKPIRKDRIITAIQNALSITQFHEKKSDIQNKSFSNLIGADTTLKPVISMAKKVASTNIPVFVYGETGVGKEMLARAIHQASQRFDKPFIAVNCGAIPEKLIESILFGHEKGAFTGAIQKTLGKFREADGGTIFLDEVGELPLDAQIKLLRVLQESEIEPVGAGKSIPINTRIISATNLDLDKEVSEGRFREDLFFRLNVLPLSLPPLRHRKNDITALTHYFINQFSLKHRKSLKTISDEALETLKNYSWPGNIRELENILYRSLILSDNEILQASDIIITNNKKSPRDQTKNESISVLNSNGNLCSLREIENQFFKLALQHCQNNFTKTARSIGIAKSTLYRKLNQNC